MPPAERAEARSLAERIAAYGTGRVADALDRLGARGVAVGLHLVCGPARPLAGPLITWKFSPVAEDHPVADAADLELRDDAAGAILAVDTTKVGDVGSVDAALASYGRAHGVKAIITDGACRDVDAMAAMDLPVYGRGVVPLGRRGRLVHVTTRQPVIIGDLLLETGDWAVCDSSGVVFAPNSQLHAIVRVLEGSPSPVKHP